MCCHRFAWLCICFVKPNLDNQDSKQIYIADTADKPDCMLKKFQIFNPQLQKVGSQNTKARDRPIDYECNDGYRTCIRDNYRYSHNYDCMLLSEMKSRVKYSSYPHGLC